MEFIKSCLDLVCEQMKEKEEVTKLKFHPDKLYFEKQAIVYSTKSS